MSKNMKNYQIPVPAIEDTDCALCSNPAEGRNLCSDCKAYIDYLANGGGIIVDDKSSLMPSAASGWVN